MGASGAISAGSTKGMESPALAACGQACDAPDGLASAQKVRLDVIGSVDPVVALVAAVAAQALPGNLLVVEREDVVVGTGGRWPGSSEKRDARCHDKSDAFGPGPRAGCSDASGCIRRLRCGGTVEAGRVCTLLGRTSRLFPNRELCAARQRMPDEG